jgi:IPT/TIG domain
MTGASFAAALATVLAAVVVVAAQGPDHQAHAVPGDAQTVYDLDANGVEVVELDGSLSHSHYFAAGPPVVNGQIVKYEWRNPGAPSGKTVLCSGVKCALTLPVGEHYIELTVTDQTGAAASAVVVVSVKSGSSAAGKPKVNSVSPSQGTTAGGQKVTILGSGFFGNVGVKFDATPAKSVTVVSENKLEAVSPAHVVGTAKVMVTTVNGDSSAGSFAYKDGGAAVSWREEVWRNADGSEWNVAEEVSGVAVGPDGRFYLSTLVGKVWAVDVGPDFVVRSACSGAQMGRAIYAIAWNPADKQKRLVVSTNTMWFRDAGSNWHSSKVEFVYIGGKNGECLTRGEVILDNLVRAVWMTIETFSFPS